MTETRSLVLSFENTLATGNHTGFPNAVAALDALARFETARGGKPLHLGVVVDSSLDEPGDAHALLEGLGLGELLGTGQVVVLGTPDRAEPSTRSVESVFDQLGVEHSAKAVAFITGHPGWRAACQALEVPVLFFDPSGAAAGDFRDWSEAPLLVSQRFFPGHTTNFEIALGVYLSLRHDAELVSYAIEPAGQASLVAKSWVSLEDKRLGALDGVHVQLPTRFRIEIRGDRCPEFHATPTDPEAVSEALGYVLSMKARDEVQEFPDAARSGQTHVVEVGPDGRRRLVRRRFS